MLTILSFRIFSLSNKPGVILTPWYHSRVKKPKMFENENFLNLVMLLSIRQNVVKENLFFVKVVKKKLNKCCSS